MNPLDLIFPKPTEAHRDLLDSVGIEGILRERLEYFVAIIKVKDIETYEHSVRVARFGKAIAEAMHINPKVMVYAGLLHDIGKMLTDLDVLHKKEGFTEQDLEHVSQHVINGYMMIKGVFDFTAEIILWHHKFQPRAYPQEEKMPLHEYTLGTKIMIPFYGRLLALADFYDATHRENDKYGYRTGKELRAIIEKNNEDQAQLVADLYNLNIFDDSLGTGWKKDE